MSDRDPRVILDEMIESITLIRSYTRDATFETFGAQRLLQDAVIHRIEILGEAASQMPTEFQSQHPAVPWRVITDMRNRLIHGYFAVRLDLVWQMVIGDLPPLEAQLLVLRTSL